MASSLPSFMALPCFIPSKKKTWICLIFPRAKYRYYEGWLTKFHHGTYLESEKKLKPSTKANFVSNVHLFRVGLCSFISPVSTMESLLSFKLSFASFFIVMGCLKCSLYFSMLGNEWRIFWLYIPPIYWSELFSFCFIVLLFTLWVTAGPSEAYLLDTKGFSMYGSSAIIWPSLMSKLYFSASSWRFYTHFLLLRLLSYCREKNLNIYLLDSSKPIETLFNFETRLS